MLCYWWGKEADCLRFRSETGDQTIGPSVVGYYKTDGKWLLEGKEGFSAYKGEVV